MSAERFMVCYCPYSQIAALARPHLCRLQLMDLYLSGGDIAETRCDKVG